MEGNGTYKICRGKRADHIHVAVLCAHLSEGQMCMFRCFDELGAARDIDIDARARFSA